MSNFFRRQLAEMDRAGTSRYCSWYQSALRGAADEVQAEQLRQEPHMHNCARCGSRKWRTDPCRLCAYNDKLRK